MAKGRSKKAKRGPEVEGGSRLAGAWASAKVAARWAFRSMVALAWVAVFAGVAIGWGPMTEAVASARGGEVEVEIAWVGDPAHRPEGESASWLVEMAHEHLVEEVSRVVGASSPLDRAGLAAARERVLDSGWFASVDEVRRGPDGRVVVEGVHRREGAVVVWGGEAHVVSPEGVPLELPSGAPMAEGLYVIVHAQGGPARRPDGSIDRRVAWRSGGVPDALAVLRLVAGLDTEVERAIDGVDLGRLRHDGVLLLTDRGGWLRWGAGVGRMVPGEVDDDRKLANIARVLTPSERLDRPGEMVDVSVARPMVDRTFGR